MDEGTNSTRVRLKMGFLVLTVGKNGLTLLGLAIYLGLAQGRGMAFFCLGVEKVGLPR